MENQKIKRVLKDILHDPAIQHIQAALSSETTPSLYLVGGALRDSWLKRPVMDFDFVVPGQIQPAVRRLAQRLSAHYVVLDEEWEVIRLIWQPPGGGPKPINLDFTPMRGNNIQEDLWQRDFTCNAMAFAIDKGSGQGPLEWADPTGGIQDMGQGIVRMVHPDRLCEDPLRLLRAFRMACSLQFEIEPSTFKIIQTESERVLSAAPERIRDEIFKMFTYSHSYPYLQKMDDSGLLTVIFPELKNLKGLKQGGFHHLDAWGHTLETYRILEQGFSIGFIQPAAWQEFQDEWQKELIRQTDDFQYLIKIAALLHDIGKPATYSIDTEDKVHFYGHARLGAELAGDILNRLRTSRNEQEKVKKWVQYHMGPIHLQQSMEKGSLTEKAKIRFLRRLGHETLAMLLLSWADNQASTGLLLTENKRKDLYLILDSLFNLYWNKDAASLHTQPYVTGRDIMEELGLPAGPLIGRLLRLLEEARIQDQIRSRSEALSLAKSLLEKL